MQSLARLGHYDWWIAWLCYGSTCVRCLFQGHKDALPSSGTEPRVVNLAVANVRFHPLSCTSALSVSVEDTTAHHAQFGHRTSNLTTTVYRFKKLSYADAQVSQHPL